MMVIATRKSRDILVSVTGKRIKVSFGEFKLDLGNRGTCDDKSLVLGTSPKSHFISIPLEAPA